MPIKRKSAIKRSGRVYHKRLFGDQSGKSVLVGAAALSIVKTAARMSGLTPLAGRFGQPVETLVTGVALKAVGSSGADLISSGVKEVASEAIEYSIELLTSGAFGLFGAKSNGKSVGGSI
jgi:hypothetical protein